MVLRRLGKAIRSQDWFTVFVELLVLIVGVFLGLQVDDWNQRRLDRIEEQYYLDRLGRDLKRSLMEQEEQLEAAKTKFEDTYAIQKVLEAGDLGSMTADEFEHRIGRIRGFASSSLVTATLQELIAGGGKHRYCNLMSCEKSSLPLMSGMRATNGLTSTSPARSSMLTITFSVS